MSSNCKCVNPCQQDPCPTCTPVNTTATPLDPCPTVEYCDEGCAETILDECVETRCGSLEEVIDLLFDEDCNAIPGCIPLGLSPTVNVCQNEEVDVRTAWLSINPTLTNGVIHPILTPEFVGGESFTPTIVGEYLFQFSQYQPCFKAQLITLNVEDCVGLCPTEIIISNAFNVNTELFDFNLSSDFPEDSIYRIKVSLPDTTVVAELETNIGDISNLANHIDNTNWNTFDQYLSTIVLNATNLNTGIAFTFDKEQWAIDNSKIYNSKSNTDATQLVFVFSIEKPLCAVHSEETTVNRVVGAMLGSGYAIYNNGAPGYLQYNIQSVFTSKSPVFGSDTVSVNTLLPGIALPTITSVNTPTAIDHTYVVAPLGVIPTELNQYDLNMTTDLGHSSTVRGFEASGYDFTILHNISNYALQEEIVGDAYNIDIRMVSYFQEAHWDESTILGKVHFNLIGGVPITTPLSFVSGGGASAADTHELGAVESAVLAVGNYQLYSVFKCDFTYETGEGPDVIEKEAFKFSDLELNYMY